MSLSFSFLEAQGLYLQDKEMLFSLLPACARVTLAGREEEEAWWCPPS
jgi:hypothetical protein